VRIAFVPQSRRLRRAALLGKVEKLVPHVHRFVYLDGIFQLIVLDWCSFNQSEDVKDS
jgi:hypothetical protein